MHRGEVGYIQHRNARGLFDWSRFTAATRLGRHVCTFSPFPLHFAALARPHADKRPIIAHACSSRSCTNWVSSSLVLHSGATVVTEEGAHLMPERQARSDPKYGELQPECPLCNNRRPRSFSGRLGKIVWQERPPTGGSLVPSHPALRRKTSASLAPPSCLHTIAQSRIFTAFGLTGNHAPGLSFADHSLLHKHTLVYLRLHHHLKRHFLLDLALPTTILTSPYLSSTNTQPQIWPTPRQTR